MPAWASFEMSASSDGLTLSRRTSWEHKQWAEALAASVAAGILPDEHQPQCQQLMMVTGSEKVIFTVSDGTAEKRVSMEVFPDLEWQERILAGWCQFDKDLAAYSLPEAEKALAAEPVLALPAVSVQVSGQISIVQNFNVFEVALRGFLQNDLIREPKTDQDFVDLDLQIKQMIKAEDALDAAEAQMLAQIQSVDEAKRQKDLLRELVRVNRIMAEKLLSSEKERRRAELIEAARNAFFAHILSLQNEIEGLAISVTINVATPDFAGSIKGLKTLSSMKDKLDTALANGKSAADTLASELRAKLKWVNENVAEYRALLPDLQQLAVKPMDDFRLVITTRINEHKRVEQEKIDKAAQKIVDDQNAAAELAAAKQSEGTELSPTAQTLNESNGGQLFAATHPTVALAPWPTPTKKSAKPTLKLGQINERLAPLSITVDGLAQLGFAHAATDKSAKLYFESDFPAMCAAMAKHLQAAVNQPRKEAA